MFDYLYGYPGRGILYEDVELEKVGLDRALEDFGPIETRTKELLLSTDWVEYFMGTFRFNTLVDDGGHTSMYISSHGDINTNPARARKRQACWEICCRRGSSWSVCCRIQ